MSTNSAGGTGFIDQKARDAADLSGSPLTAIDDQIFPTNLADFVPDGTFCVRNTPADVATFGLGDHVDGDVLKKVGATWKRLLRPIAGTTVIWLTTFGKLAIFVDEPVAGSFPLFVNTLDTGEAFSVAYIGTNLPGQISFDGTLLIGNIAGGLTAADFGNATVLLLTGTLVLWIRDTVNPERSGIYNLIVNNAGTGDYTLRRDYNFRDSSSFTDGQTFFVGSGSGGDEANKNYLISLTQQFIINTTALAIVEGTIANLAQVPTVAKEIFASTNARFFGELGLPTGQQTWEDIATGSATIDLAIENVFGKSKQVIKHNDNVTNGSTTSQISLTAQNWIDINAFGDVSFSGTSRLDTIDGVNGFFSGLQANAAENPLATGNRRYGINFNDNGGFLRLTEADNTGNNVTMDGTGGNPLITFDEWFRWLCKVPAGLGAAQVIINRKLTTFVPTFIINGGGLGTRVLVSSGSSAGAQRVVFHDNFGVSIHEESNVKTLSPATMLANIKRIFAPEGDRDYTIKLPDGSPSKLGDKLDFIFKNVGGKLKVQTQNLSAPQALFNGDREIEREITDANPISLINTVDNSNIYVGQFEEKIIYEHSGLISTGEPGGFQGISIVSPTAPAIFRLAKIHSVNVDRSQNLDIANQIDIRLPQTDETILGGGDQIINVYINKQGVYEFRPDEPTIAAITDETFVAKLVMVAGVITVAVFTPVVAYNASVDVIGELINRGGQKTDGSILSPGGANLTLSVTAGSHQQLGRGLITDPNAPNLCTTEVKAVIAFTGTTGNLFLVHADSGGNFITDQFISNSANPDIDPTTFNPSGGAALVTVGPNKFTVKRVYQACETNDIIVYSGTVEYGSLAAAETGFKDEDPEILTTKDISHICDLIVKENVTDLTAAVLAFDAKFINRSGQRDL